MSALAAAVEAAAAAEAIAAVEAVVVVAAVVATEAVVAVVVVSHSAIARDPDYNFLSYRASKIGPLLGR
jgi:hypothetical protein